MPGPRVNRTVRDGLAAAMPDGSDSCDNENDSSQRLAFITQCLQVCALPHASSLQLPCLSPLARHLPPSVSLSLSVTPSHAGAPRYAPSLCTAPLGMPPLPYATHPRSHATYPSTQGAPAQFQLSL